MGSGGGGEGGWGRDVFSLEKPWQQLFLREQLCTARPWGRGRKRGWGVSMPAMLWKQQHQVQQLSMAGCAPRASFPPVPGLAGHLSECWHGAMGSSTPSRATEGQSSLLAVLQPLLVCIHWPGQEGVPDVRDGQDHLPWRAGTYLLVQGKYTRETPSGEPKGSQ